MEDTTIEMVRHNVKEKNPNILIIQKCKRMTPFRSKKKTVI